MDSYYMSICPGCKKLFKTKNNGKAIKCPKCQDTLLISMGFTEEEWKTKSKTDKDALIDKILNKAIIQETSQPQKVNEKKANINANDYSDFWGVSSTESNELNTKKCTHHSSFFEGFEPQNDFGAVPTPATQQISHNSNTSDDSNISLQSNNMGQKHSGLSIGAFITSFFACLSIFGIILGIFDLAKGDPKKSIVFQLQLSL